jgi:hypothetical protein
MAEIKTIEKDIVFFEKMLKGKGKLKYTPSHYELKTCAKFFDSVNRTCDKCPLYQHMNAGERCENTALYLLEEHHYCNEEDDGHDYGGKEILSYLTNACEYCRQQIVDHIAFLKKAVRVISLK